MYMCILLADTTWSECSMDVVMFNSIASWTYWRAVWLIQEWCYLHVSFGDMLGEWPVVMQCHPHGHAHRHGWAGGLSTTFWPCPRELRWASGLPAHSAQHMVTVILHDHWTGMVTWASWTWQYHNREGMGGLLDKKQLASWCLKLWVTTFIPQTCTLLMLVQGVCACVHTHTIINLN